MAKKTIRQRVWLWKARRDIRKFAAAITEYKRLLVVMGYSRQERRQMLRDILAGRVDLSDLPGEL